MIQVIPVSDTFKVITETGFLSFVEYRDIDHAAYTANRSINLLVARDETRYTNIAFLMECIRCYNNGIYSLRERTSLASDQLEISKLNVIYLPNIEFYEDNMLKLSRNKGKEYETKGRDEEEEQILLLGDIVTLRVKAEMLRYMMFYWHTMVKGVNIDLVIKGKQAGSIPVELFATIQDLVDEINKHLPEDLVQPETIFELAAEHKYQLNESAGTNDYFFLALDEAERVEDNPLWPWNTRMENIVVGPFVLLNGLRKIIINEAVNEAE
jgi:hypothetical protein